MIIKRCRYEQAASVHPVSYSSVHPLHVHGKTSLCFLTISSLGSRKGMYTVECIYWSNHLPNFPVDGTARATHTMLAAVLLMIPGLQPLVFHGHSRACASQSREAPSYILYSSFFINTDVPYVYPTVSSHACIDILSPDAPNHAYCWRQQHDHPEIAACSKHIHNSYFVSHGRRHVPAKTSHTGAPVNIQ